MIPVTVLGSTGSIGKQTLEILEVHNKSLEVFGLSCHANIELLQEQMKKFHPKVVAVLDEKMAARLKKKLKESTIKILTGINGVTELASQSGVKKIVIGMSGEQAIHPLLAAIQTKNDIILANKEAVVCHGAKILKEVERTGTGIIPADSELCAIFQCLEYWWKRKNEIKSTQSDAISGSIKNMGDDTKSASMKKAENQKKNNILSVTGEFLKRVEEAIRQDSFFRGMNNAERYMKMRSVSSRKGICFFDTSIIEKVILTCSGGPFFKKNLQELNHVTLENALKHPVWRMGKNISIDSATLVNKGLEVIETHHLFGLPYESIQAVIHPESIIHAIVYFKDGEVMAVKHAPDMKISLEYALLFGENIEPFAAERLNLHSKDHFLEDQKIIQSLHFYPVDHQTFPALQKAYEAGKGGEAEEKKYCLNNEKQRSCFLKGQLNFVKLLNSI